MQVAQLYKEAGVNPLAGCLPTLATLPVWIGLYRSAFGWAVSTRLLMPLTLTLVVAQSAVQRRGRRPPHSRLLLDSVSCGANVTCSTESCELAACLPPRNGKPGRALMTR